MNVNDLFIILKADHPMELIKAREDEVFKLIPELKRCKGFNQNSPWHIYDVYEHILHVVDNVPNDLVIRLAALFHDIGKPLSYSVDEDGVGHFYGHWVTSDEIFYDFALRNCLDEELTDRISNLIFYHDLNFDHLNDDDLKKANDLFSRDDLMRLFILKKADLLAQNNKYHNLLDNLYKQELHLLKAKKD